MARTRSPYPPGFREQIVDRPATVGRGYCAWRDRPLSRRDREDKALKREFAVIHRRSRGTYGAPRIHAELTDQSTRVGRKRIDGGWSVG